MANDSIIRTDFDLFDLTPVGICVINKYYDVLFWNTRLEEWTSLSRENIINRNLLEFFPHFDSEFYRIRMDSVFDGGTPVIFTAHLHKKLFNNLHKPEKKHFQNVTITKAPQKDGSILAIITVENVNEVNYRLEKYRQLKHSAEIEIEKRRAAEDSASKSHQMIENIINQVPQYIFWKDTNSVYVGCNRQYAFIKGLNSPAEIVGKTDYDILPNREMADRFVNADKFILNTGGTIINQIREVTDNKGYSKWYQINKIPLYNENIEIIGILGTLEDITEKKNNEILLKEQRANLQAILDHTDQSIFLMNNYGELLEFNRAFKRYFSDKNNIDIHRKDNLDKIFTDKSINNQWKSRLSNNNRHSEQKFLDKIEIDGKETFLETKIYPIYDNAEMTGSSVFIRNVSDYVISRNKLKFLSNLNRILAEISAGIINKSVDEIDSILNNAIQIICQQINFEKVVIHKIQEKFLIPEFSFAEPKDNIAETLPSLAVNSFRMIFELAKDDGIIYFEDISKMPDLGLLSPNIFKTVPFKSFISLPLFLNNQLYGFLSFASYNHTVSVNEELRTSLKIFSEIISSALNKKQYENELILRKDEAESAYRSKSNFIANVSHEIRTPLNSIIGFSELLREKSTDTHLREYINGVTSSAKNLLLLINDILDISKIEAGKVEINQTMIEPNKIIYDLNEIFKLSAASKNLRLKFEIDDNVPQFLFVDETRIRQILFNLVGNAIKFTNIGSVKVEIRVDNLNKKENSATLIIIVSDSGIGISDSKFETIFEPFSQIEENSTRKFAGTGLGLAISRRLARMMNGDIAIDSSLDVGSKFTLSLNDVRISNDNKSVLLSDKSSYNMELLKLNVCVFGNYAEELQLIFDFLNNKRINFDYHIDFSQVLESAVQKKYHLLIYDCCTNFHSIDKLISEVNSFKSKNISNILIILNPDLIDEEVYLNIKNYADFILTNQFKSEDFTGIFERIVLNKISLRYDNNIEDFNENDKQNISEEVSNIILNKLKNNWETVRKGNVLVEIGKFADDCKNIGDSNNDKCLLNYGNSLKESVEVFDIENMIKLLDEFEKFIKRAEEFKV